MCFPVSQWYDSLLVVGMHLSSLVFFTNSTCHSGTHVGLILVSERFNWQKLQIKKTISTQLLYFYPSVMQI